MDCEWELLNAVYWAAAGKDQPCTHFPKLPLFGLGSLYANEATNQTRLQKKKKDRNVTSLLAKWNTPLSHLPAEKQTHLHTKALAKSMNSTTKEH